LKLKTRDSRLFAPIRLVQYPFFMAPTAEICHSRVHDGAERRGVNHHVDGNLGGGDRLEVLGVSAVPNETSRA